jgi:hypothetical protein
VTFTSGIASDELDRAAVAPGRSIATTYASIWALTAAAAAASTLLPQLAPSTPPHPTLHGATGETLTILAGNLRILAAPILLIAVSWHTRPVTQRLGDLLVLGLIAGNAIAYEESRSGGGTHGYSHTYRTCHSSGSPSPSQQAAGT